MMSWLNISHITDAVGHFFAVLLLQEVILVIVFFFDKASWDSSLMSVISVCVYGYRIDPADGQW